MALRYSDKSNQLPRIVPDLARLIPDEVDRLIMGVHGNNGRNGGGLGSAAAAVSGGLGVVDYEHSDLTNITRAQMHEDLLAYRYDLEFCQTQLSTQPGLTPQEIRTLQIRILDCGHNIRHCKHRVQTLDAQARLGMAPFITRVTEGSGTGSGGYHSGGTAAQTSKNKRQRIRKSNGGEFDGVGNGVGDSMFLAAGGEADADADGDGVDDSIVAAATETNATSPPTVHTHGIQRLGYWDCRLCRSRKYLEAGPNRVPSAPCKWPLKDISKMINHFLDLHTEHTPEERCSELGDALARNRGPFEYWLTRTKSQDLDSDGVIDEYIHTLQEGSLPGTMRGLIRAAAAFPNSVSTAYKK